MSLVTTPACKLGSCALCASTRITEITMTLTDGSRVDFVSCHACEVKSWKQDGVELGLAAVLANTRKPRLG